MRRTAAGRLPVVPRRGIGYRDLAKLVIAIERHTPSLPRRTAAIRRSHSPLPCDRQPVRIVTEVPRRSGVRPDCWRSMIRTS